MMNEYPLDKITCMGGWFMPENLCDDIINYYNSNTSLQHKGEVGVSGKGKKDGDHGIVLDVKDSTDIPIGHFESTEPFHTYRELLQKCLNKYIEKYPNVDGCKRFNINEPYNIQYYKPYGGFKKWHFEDANRLDRLFAFMTYLNDCDDGGTEFRYQGFTTPAKKGLTLIWPANWTHTHRGQISKTKEKYIVTGWYSINA